VKKTMPTIRAAALVLGIAAWPSVIHAADFYQGRNITIVVGSGPGSFDLYARVIARHLGRFIPGNPNVIVQNMPGGGSLKAANYVYSIAPKDGTILGYVTQNIGIEEALGTPGVEYVTSKYNWIGRLSSTANITLTPKASAVKTIEDAKAREVILSGTGGVSPLSTDPILSNRLLGTRFKVINGYTDSVSVILALERGEVDGTTLSRSTLLSVRPQWDRDKTMNYLVQYAGKRHPGFPDVPTILELAQTDQQKSVALFFTSAVTIGRAFMAPPGVPKEQLTQLRAGFEAMVRDPKLMDDVTKTGIEFDPLAGDALQSFVEGAVFDPAVIKMAREIRGSQ
jgi:tripartite-type tricarboxylate transporter receptor subunit TctC